MLTNLHVVLRSFGDQSIFGESFGDGPTRVLWLHGWERRSHDFGAAGRALAQLGHASVALDLPGFGVSPTPPHSGGARYYANLLETTIRAVANEPVILVGHSFGGRVATVLASEYPELVRSLILTGVPLLRTTTRSRSPLAFRSLRWLNAHRLLSEARMELARQRYGSRDYRRASGVMREVLVASVNESYEAELSSLKVPVHFVWGDRDDETPKDVMTRATLLTRDFDVLVLPNVGHLVPVEAPLALVEVVVRVLGS
jgi:pimeloyl-ACP methyl ester carboxylesterase